MLLDSVRCAGAATDNPWTRPLLLIDILPTCTLSP
jgi:hypothetical protein